MRANSSSLLSSPKNEANVSERRGDKFQLVNCPIKGIYCNEVLSEINDLYQKSQLYRINKEYQNSIELLEIALSKTMELKEPACEKCAGFFKSTIKNTSETMQDELQKMSFGFFRPKRFQTSHLKFDSILKRMNLL